MRGRTPKRKLSKEQQEAADAFIDAAEENSDEDIASETESPQTPQETYPWEEPHVRDDVTKTYLLRMSEPLHLKLKYLSEKTGKSMNQICTDAVEEEVLERLDEIVGER